jgi:pimeloyl-ACP methyl ester carboxylesterase
VPGCCIIARFRISEAVTSQCHRDKDTAAVPGVVNEKEYHCVTVAPVHDSACLLCRGPHLGGMEQWILVQGEKESNPVLLFLHGGPGVPIIPFVRDFDVYATLQEHFVMVYWDQRGAGKSYHPGIPVTEFVCQKPLAEQRQAWR